MSKQKVAIVGDNTGEKLAKAMVKAVEQKDKLREDVAVYLWAIVSAFTHTFQGKEYRDWDDLPQLGKDLVYPVAGQILALIEPLIEEKDNIIGALESEVVALHKLIRTLQREIKEAKTQERERVIDYLEYMVWVFNPKKERSEFLGIIQELKSELWRDWQALKEEK